MRLPERVRASLELEPQLAPLTGDLPQQRALATAPAAVLIALTDREEPGVIPTVRREHLRTHAGQIAFPGGRVDEGEDVVAAALREAQEELGLASSAVDVIGTIDAYRTVTGYVVTPVIGIVPPGLPLEPHEPEVAEWFEAPLQFLIDPANHTLQTAVFGGRERRYWQIQWNGRRIWGATAAMLVNLSRRLQWT
jgi:8-oxo-dGTP pyrophosphatase MutT (NUDIX family)